MSHDARCEVCGSNSGVKRYAVTIDGKALNLSPLLCTEHGERFIIRAGFMLGSLQKPLGDLLKDW